MLVTLNGGPISGGPQKSDVEHQWWLCAIQDSFLGERHEFVALRLLGLQLALWTPEKLLHHS